MTTLERRWYRFTPDRFLFGLLAVVGFLLLSEQFGWFAFNEKKGWTVLIAVATVCGAVLFMLLWLAASLIFRRRFQFGIRSLAVFVTVCAMVCSWFAVRMQQAKRQQEIFAELREFQGRIAYDFQLDSATKQPPAPAWLRERLGDDFFADLENICLGGDREFTDAKLASIGELSKLEFLRFDAKRTSDTGLGHLRGLIRLEHLSIVNSEITDAGLEHLENLTSLKRLYLNHAQVTDAGLEHLEGLSDLEILRLDSPHVTDTGLEHLKGLAKLKTLHLEGTQITKKGVEGLREALPDCEIEH